MTNLTKRADRNLADLWEGVKARAIAARSPATLRAYKYDWDRYCDWCLSNALPPLPCSGDQLAAYVVSLDEGGLKTASIDRALVSLSQAHKLAGLESPSTAPIVREVLKGIKRVKGTAQARAAALSLEHLGRAVGLLGSSSSDLRDRALLLLGWSAALRRSEIVALDCTDLEFVAEGVVVRIRRSKTDQEGQGQAIGVPFGRGLCPVCPLRDWLCTIPKTGPVFRRIWKGGAIAGSRLHPTAVTTIVKRAVAAAGYDPDLFSAHSLRSGFATAAAGAGIEERHIMAHTRHRSVIVARRYIREGSLFLNNPLKELL